MGMVKFYKGGDMPLELHKVRVVQKLHLVPVERRLDAMKKLVSTHSASEQRMYISICSLTAVPTP